MKKQSQESAIIKHLQRGKKLTGMDALNKFKCWRLASRISALKKEGHAISKKMIKTKSGKRVAQYSL